MGSMYSKSMMRLTTTS